VAAGYIVRTLGDVAELPARSLVSWKAFHPDEPDERYEGWTWYHNVQRAPLYRRDLDLVAVAPDGELASFCTVWFDDVNRTGVFEPVGTAPAHQRRGLGKAVMCEGLRRLKCLGATLATVGSYSPEAGALYAAAGFTEYELLERWIKVF
jgi:GNAT superfamily N-acetyltransferase